MRAFVALLLTVPLLAMPAAGVMPVTQAACADAATPVLFAQWDTQLENLAFDGNGRLYVSDLGGDRLLAYTSDGALDLVRAVPGMHGLIVAPNGDVYVGASGGGAAQVWRFDDVGAGMPTVVASGFSAANGLAFGPTGDLFVSSPLATSPPYLYRLPAHDMAAWTPWGDTYGTNGLWLDADGSLLAAVTGDQSSPIVRISATDASSVQTVAELSFGSATLQPNVHAPSGQLAVAPKGLDDLTVGPDGMIYVTAHVTGELLRVDPATGAACVLASGFKEPTSVRTAEGFGAWDGWLFVTDMGGVGVTALATPAAGAVWAVPLVAS